MEKLRRFQKSPLGSLFTLLSLLAFAGVFAGHFHLHPEVSGHLLECPEHHQTHASQYQIHTASCAVCSVLAHSFLAKDSGSQAGIQNQGIELVPGSPAGIFKPKHLEHSQPSRAPPYSS